jgi:ABC-type transport system substrate-binding protein
VGPRNKFLVYVGFILVLFLSVSSSSVGTQPLTDVPVVNPGIFIIETGNLPYSIDPALNSETSGKSINEQVCETLVDFKDNFALLQPQLATNWSWSDDGLEWTFNLRQGVTFTDGAPFNAWVMKYSLDRVIFLNGDPAWLTQKYILGSHLFQRPTDGNVSEAITYLSYTGIRVIDEFTLKINISSAVPLDYILQNRAACAISPKFVIEHRPAIYTTYNGSLTEEENISAMVPLTSWFPNLTDWTKLGLSADHDPLDSGVVPNSYPQSSVEHTYYADHMVGTGPYKYVSFTEREVQLEKNTNWWNKQTFHQNAPNKVIWRLFGEYPTMLQDLKNGTCDMVARLAPAQHLEILASENGIFKLPYESLDPGIQVFEQYSPIIRTLSFNMNDSLPNVYLYESPSTSFFNITYYENNTLDPADDTPRVLYRYADKSLGIASQDNPFTSLLFRKAFTMSVDIESLTLLSTNGLGIKPNGIIPKGSFGYVSNLIEQEFNPEEAKLLFEQVGWKGSITLKSNRGNSYMNPLVLHLKEVIEGLNIGISLTLIDPPWGGGWIFNNNDPSKYLPLEFSGWIGDYAHAHDFVTEFYHGSYGLYAKKYHYNNPSVNELIDKTVIEPDLVKKAEMYRWIEQNATQDYAMIYTLQEIRPRFFRSWIENVEESGSLHSIRSSPVISALGKPDFWDPTQAQSTQTQPLTSTKTTHPTTTIEGNIENNFNFNIQDIISNLTTIALAGSVGSIGGLILAIVIKRDK